MEKMFQILRGSMGHSPPHHWAIRWRQALGTGRGHLRRRLRQCHVVIELRSIGVVWEAGIRKTGIPIMNEKVNDGLRDCSFLCSLYWASMPVFCISCIQISAADCVVLDAYSPRICTDIG